jgi:hypothetical protein
MDQANSLPTPIPFPLDRLAKAVPAKSTEPGLLGAHTHLVERIAVNEHLRNTLLAVGDYVGAIVADTAALSYLVDIRRDYVAGTINDLLGDTAGAIAVAAEEWAEQNGQFGVGA